MTEAAAREDEDEDEADARHVAPIDASATGL